MNSFNRQYPNGRLSADDDGQTSIGMAVDKDSGVIYIRFTTPVEWIGLDANSAMNFLTTLAKQLSTLSGVPISVSIGSDDPVSEVLGVVNCGLVGGEQNDLSMG
jgi:hypothetical protein